MQGLTVLHLYGIGRVFVRIGRKLLTSRVKRIDISFVELDSII